MRVKTTKSFSANLDGELYHFGEGTIFELPDGVDWLRAGLVVPVRGEVVETAVVGPQEKAITVQDLPGIGKDRAEALAQLGIVSVETLAGAEAVIIAGEISGVGLATARKWIEAAQEEMKT